MNPDPTRRLAVSDQAAAQLRALIGRHDYTREGIGARLGLTRLRGLDGVPLAIHRRRLAGDDPADTMIVLFLLAEPVPEQLAAEHLGLGDARDWIEQEILIPAGDDAGMVRGGFILLPGEDLVLASDWPTSSDDPMLRPDHVLGDNPTAEILSNITVSGEFGTMLDLGAGGGVQALSAHPRVGQVTATDLNPRATAFAELNQRLNERPIECLTGNLFEPVGDRRFDLIVTNPPFVIAPEATFSYRDSELGGEGITRAIITGSAAHLNDGGFCQLLCNVSRHGEDDPWDQRFEELIAATGLSAWVIVLDMIEVAEYAAGWLRQSMITKRGRLADELNRWLDFYAADGITDIAWCAVTLRRRDDAPRFFDLSTLERRFNQAAGDQVRRCFEARELLAASEPDDLLDMYPVVHPEARLETEMAPGEGGWEVAASRLFPPGGLPFEGEIDAHVANMVVSCDGRRTLRQLMVGAAELAEVPEPEMIRGGVELVRRLLTTGSITIHPAPVET